LAGRSILHGEYDSDEGPDANLGKIEGKKRKVGLKKEGRTVGVGKNL